MLGFFIKKAEKKEVEQLKNAVQTGFNTVKQDMGNLSTWIKHLDSSDSKLNNEIMCLKEELSTVKEELDELKNAFSVVGTQPVFKHRPTVFNEQTSFKDVQTGVQTGVQTVFLDNLSTTERAIVFVLLNSDMKLSYEDLAAMLGKRKATIRGQINSIRQKSEGLIQEIVGENNKKRVFISIDLKEKLQKQGKVSNKYKNNKKSEDFESF